ALAVRRDRDADRLATVVDEFVRVEELLPDAPPALAFEAAHPPDPAGGVVRVRRRRPRPDRVRVEETDQAFGVLLVPRAGLGVHNRLDRLVRLAFFDHECISLLI